MQYWKYPHTSCITISSYGSVVYSHKQGFFQDLGQGGGGGGETAICNLVGGGGGGVGTLNMHST